LAASIKISREKKEYYGNPKNKFWSVIFDSFGAKFSNPNYDQKKAVLFGNNIALWDVIEKCRIIGSADASIEAPVYNKKLPEFISKNNIKTIIFNGKKAFEFYRKEISETDGIILPSTSPANAGISYNEKLERWSKALKRGGGS
jgi:hypoxanthine-DNA glycosylase